MTLRDVPAPRGVRKRLPRRRRRGDHLAALLHGLGVAARCRAAPNVSALARRRSRPAARGVLGRSRDPGTAAHHPRGVQPGRQPEPLRQPRHAGTTRLGAHRVLRAWHGRGGRLHPRARFGPAATRRSAPGATPDRHSLISPQLETSTSIQLNRGTSGMSVNDSEPGQAAVFRCPHPRGGVEVPIASMESGY
jgi:hypothetical protein